MKQLQRGSRLVVPAQTVAGGQAVRFPYPYPPKRKVIVWSEGTAPKSVYPNDINGAVAAALKGLPDCTIVTASLSEPEQGLSESALADCAALVWWGHLKHGDIPDSTVQRIVRRVREGGMGFVALHSAHNAKPFQALIGNTGNWKGWREDGRPQQLLVAEPNHPVARGVRNFTIPKEEKYFEPLDAPKPDSVVFDGIYDDGTHCRQGMVWRLDRGRLLYFRPGHESYPVYLQAEVQRILRNAVLWASGYDEGIWYDTDPVAKNARATREPALGVILRHIGYSGTTVTVGDEIEAQRFVRASRNVVVHRPVAAWGLEKVCRGGWYRADKPDDLQESWQVGEKNNKENRPPLGAGRVTFDPGDAPFGLYVSTGGFTNEIVCTDDTLNAKITRFGGKPIRKAHVFAAKDDAGRAIPNAFLIGWEYSTNDDNQDIVTMVENVRAMGR